MISWDEPPPFGPSREAPPVRTLPELVAEGFTLRLAPAGYRVVGAARKLMRAGGELPGDIVAARAWIAASLTPSELSNLEMRGIFQSETDFIRRYVALPQFIRDISSGKMKYAVKTPVVLRFRLSYHWEREDPLVRVPPGATGKITRKVTVGLTEAVSREISGNIGAEIGLPGGAKLTAGAAVKDAISLTRTAQWEDTRELTLPNPDAIVRRYAVWQRRTHLDIDTLAGNAKRFYWNSLTSETLNASPSIVLTSDGEEQ